VNSFKLTPSDDRATVRHQDVKQMPVADKPIRRLDNSRACSLEMRCQSEIR